MQMVTNLVILKYSKILSIHKLIGSIFYCIKTLRGTNWRGKDCNDFSSKVYPGRRPGNDSLEDSNCNGIWVIRKLIN